MINKLHKNEKNTIKKIPTFIGILKQTRIKEEIKLPKNIGINILWNSKYRKWYIKTTFLLNNTINIVNNTIKLIYKITLFYKPI